MKSLRVVAAASLATCAQGFVPVSNQQQNMRSAPLSVSALEPPTLAAAGSNSDDWTPLRQGSYVALITPMTPTGAIDLQQLRSLLQFHLQAGTDGLCILGTTGEAAVMTMAERKAVLDVAVEEENS